MVLPRHWRERARRRLPKMIFDFVDGAAEDEVTMRRNRAAFDDLAFAGRLLQGSGTRSHKVTVLGQELALPVITAPTGLSRASGRDGEVAAARAASAAGTVSILSGTASASAEEVAAAVDEPQWFQTYLYREPERMQRMLATVRAAGFRVLVVTGDAPVGGNRERDTVNGMSIPIRVRPKMAVNAALRPRWLFDYLTGPPMVQSSLAKPPNLIQRVFPGADPSLESVMGGMFNPDQSWDDLKALRDAWSGPLVLKGVMNGDDARRAVDAGCDGIIVSNHGGRQLDSLPASIEVLPEVVDAVGASADVLLDSGVRRGSDVVKALALGAKACLIGRPWVWGLAAGGEAGIAQVLSTFASEIDRVQGLIGASDVTSLSPADLRRRPNSGWVRL